MQGSVLSTVSDSTGGLEMYLIGRVIKAPPTFTIILTLRFVPKHSYMLFAFPSKQEG